MHHRYAPHELIELHELLSHETVSAQKGSIFGQSLVDNDVRNFAQKCMSLRQKRIQDCQSIIGHTGSEVTSGSYGAGQTWGNSWGNTAGTGGGWGHTSSQGYTGSQGYEASKHNFDAGKQGYDSGRQAWESGKGYESGTSAGSYYDFEKKH